LVIQFKPSVSEAEKANARSPTNAVQKRPIKSLAHGALEVASIPPGLVVAAVIDAL
jgi:hypothetical protein